MIENQWIQIDEYPMNNEISALEQLFSSYMFKLTLIIYWLSFLFQDVFSPSVNLCDGSGGW